MERMQAKARARYAFAEFLGGCGKRCTPERLSVLDQAMECRSAFLAEDLLNEDLHVSRATIYNTLPLLVQCGLVRKVAGSNSYELVRSQTGRKPRLNLVCSVCGKVHHRAAAMFPEWIESQHLRGFSPNNDSAEIYIYGECSRCRRKSPVTKRNNLKF